MPESASSIDELQLIKRARAGDAAAFGRLYELYLDPIYRYVYFRVSRTAEAEELTDDVFVRAWEALPQYELRGHGSLLPWLYRIARNLVADHHRRRALHEDTEPLFAVKESAPSVEEMVGTQQTIGRAVRAVRKLSDVEQNILILRLVEQLPYKEIAEIVGKSAGACRVIQYRALATLRDLLAEDNADE